MEISKKIQKQGIDWGEYSQTAAWCNENHATIEDKGDYYEVVETPSPPQEELNTLEVERLKSELASTDYKCLKYIDGALSDEEYAEVRTYRAELRSKIKSLEQNNGREHC